MNQLSKLHQKFRTNDLSAFISRAQKMDIAVVGDRAIGKTTLIKFWLSLTTDTVITSDIYSKMIWLDQNPIQLTIYEISSKNVMRPNLFKKYYHAIVYLYDIDKESTWTAIPQWIEYMKTQINDLTYQTILGLSNKPDEQLELESETYLKTRKFYAQMKIAYNIHSIQPSESLSKLVGMITDEAYDAVKKIPAINASDYGDPNLVEMDIFDPKANHPLLIRRTGDESLKPVQMYRPENNCCVII